MAANPDFNEEFHHSVRTGQVRVRHRACTNPLTQALQTCGAYVAFCFTAPVNGHGTVFAGDLAYPTEVGATIDRTIRFEVIKVSIAVTSGAPQAM